MVKYLKEAFWASPHMPGLEQVPVNALAVAAFGIFEFAESWIWLVGLGLETAYLYACFTSDLQRLEAKVELALENARMGRGTEIIATEIDMTGRSWKITFPILLLEPRIPSKTVDGWRIWVCSLRLAVRGLGNRAS
jgi:hypothetical protein